MIAQFSLRLIFGMSLMWCLMPRREVTSGFFRIQMLVTLGLSVLSALTVGQLAPLTEETAPVLPAGLTRMACVVLAVSSFVGSVLWTLERRTGGSRVAFLIAGLSAATLLMSSFSAEAFGSSLGMLSVLSELSTASLLGGAMTSMLLGHWYLTAPTMSIAPLNRLTLYFGVAAAVRLLLSSLALMEGWDQIAGPTYGLWVTLRWIAGVLGPLAVFVMTWRILKYRNTQSATGVLFVGVILTFIGELTASLLYRELFIPL